VSDAGKGIVAGCTVLIVILLVGIFSDWYRFGDERVIPRPDRPAHPIGIYYPPGWKQ